jgi:hypothetical protein
MKGVWLKLWPEVCSDYQRLEAQPNIVKDIVELVNLRRLEEFDNAHVEKPLLSQGEGSSNEELGELDSSVFWRQRNTGADEAELCAISPLPV